MKAGESVPISKLSKMLICEASVIETEVVPAESARRIREGIQSHKEFSDFLLRQGNTPLKINTNDIKNGNIQTIFATKPKARKTRLWALIIGFLIVVYLLLRN
jgi:hypothetical protein